MWILSLPVHEPLAEASRVSGATRRLGVSSVASTGILLMLGVSAALLTLNVHFAIHIPGHAILKCSLPMALGLALVPRRSAGSLMGIAAGATALCCQGLFRDIPGWGTTTSLLVTGPILDLAVRSARSGRGVYIGLIVGSGAANLVAFAIRFGAKVIQYDGTRPLASWLPQAMITYTLCGLAAGLLSALLWFRFSGSAGSRAQRPGGDDDFHVMAP